MRKLNLYQLANKATGISNKIGDFLAEAAQVCLELQGHQSGVVLNVIGFYQATIQLEWSTKISQETILGWKDLKETTEYGATAIALLLILELTDCNYAERLPQGAIGDYFLKKEQLENKTVENEIFLEIPGIFKESASNSINIRITQKEKQLKNKPIEDLNVLATIIEFSNPKAKIIKV